LFSSHKALRLIDRAVGGFLVAFVYHIHDGDVHVDPNHIVDAESDKHKIPEDRPLLDAHVVCSGVFINAVEYRLYQALLTVILYVYRHGKADTSLSRF
jgi:hypothetical protein